MTKSEVRNALLLQSITQKWKATLFTAMKMKKQISES